MMNSRPNTKRRARFGKCAACLALAGCLAWQVTQAADSQHDVLLFLSVEGFENLSDPVPSVDDSYLLPAVDLIYAYNRDRFRVLGEYVLSSEESEIERLQFGWRLKPNTMVWLGRFHTIAKYWTTEFHHGQFMQTSISRPGLEAWEDESGAVLSHVTGLLVEHEVERRNHQVIGLDFAIGAGAVFDDDELRPFDLLEGGKDNELAVNARITWRPNAVSENRLGVLLGRTEIPVDSGSNPALAELGDIEQLSAGAFVDWRWERWRLITSTVAFRNDLEFTDGLVRDDYVAGYLQLEYQPQPDWTVFGRSDFATGEDRSPFLQMLPAYIAHRQMLGVRWDFSDNQGLTLEVADTSTEGGDSGHHSFKEVRFQWSAVLP